MCSQKEVGVVGWMVGWLLCCVVWIRVVATFILLIILIWFISLFEKSTGLFFKLLVGKQEIQ